MLSIILLLVVIAILAGDVMFTKFLWRLSQRPRFRPTRFQHTGLPAHIVFPAPAKPFRRLDAKTNNIDDRYEFVKPLGKGCEGRADIYRDTHRKDQLVVVKTFFQGVRTNPLPEHLRLHFRAEEKSQRASWPSEIPSTLYFTCVTSPGDFHERDDGRRLNGGFIYALDYFWADTGDWLRIPGRATGGWKLVTPFLSFGTLETLADLLRHRRMKPAEIDAIYRRRYRGILEALEMMHETGYCHDDVKLDNIFVSPTNTFLLGDLGNVREHDHEFHLSSMSAPHCDYSRDDVERAIRSYLSFLRLSSGEKGWFDKEFHTRESEWSDFFWRYKAHPKSARELLEDEFWAPPEPSHGAMCDTFEQEVNNMREELRRWKSGQGDKPAWHRDQKETRRSSIGSLEKQEVANANKEKAEGSNEVAAEGNFLSRVRSAPEDQRQRQVAKQVDGELACITMGVYERLLLGQSKGKLSHSSY